MKRNIQINIGMNNNPMTQDEVIRYFASHPNYQLSGYYFKDMTFQGNTEPTFVAWIQTDLARDSRVLEDFEAIASVMTQECIALVTDSMKALAFNPSYKGERYMFNANLFEFIL
jgi:hypothetical protein